MEIPITLEEMNLVRKYSNTAKRGILKIGSLEKEMIKEIVRNSSCLVFVTDPASPPKDSIMNVEIRDRSQGVTRPIRYKSLSGKSEDLVVSFWDHSFDYIMIDCIDDYVYIKHEFELWFPKVFPGGFVLFRNVCPEEDGSWDGMNRFTTELLVDRRVTFIEKADKIKVFQRIK